MVRTSPGVTRSCVTCPGCYNLHVPPNPMEGDLSRWYIPPQVLHAPGVTCPRCYLRPVPPTLWKEISPMVHTSPGVTYLVLHIPGVTSLHVPPDSMEGNLSRWYVPPQVLHTWCYISQVLQPSCTPRLHGRKSALMVRTSPGVTYLVLHIPGVTAFMYPRTPWKEISPDGTYLPRCYIPGVTYPRCYKPSCTPQLRGRKSPPMVRTSPGVTYLVLHIPGVTAFMYPRLCGRKSPRWYIPPQVLHTWCYISQVLQPSCTPDPVEGDLPRWYVPPQVLHARCYIPQVLQAFMYPP